MATENSVGEFLFGLPTELKNEFRELIKQEVPIAVFLCWFARFPWQHYAQKKFLYALTELFPQKNRSEDRLFAAYKKRLQRIRNASPDAQRKILEKAGINFGENNVIPITFPRNYREPATFNTLLGPSASFAENTAEENFKSYLGKKGLQILNNIYAEVLANLDDFTSYHLARTGIQARARWTDESNFHDWHNKTQRLRSKNGIFLVLAGSEFSKTESLSCVKFKRIVALRQELMRSEILRDAGDVFTFTTNYPFSSPSLAASVLAGANLNGLRYWKDEYGRSLGQIRKGKFKIKRGPGRPRKSS